MTDPSTSPNQNTNTTEDRVRAYLEKLISNSNEGYAALSRRIGRNPAYIQQYLKRRVPRRLSEEDRQKLSEHFGISESLLGGRPTQDADKSLNHNKKIPCLNALDHQADGLSVDEVFLEKMRNSPQDKIAAHRINGDAMAPTLLDGDQILINTNDKTNLRDGLYAIQNNGEIFIKRISVNPTNGEISILSDNGTYASFSHCNPQQLNIVGRIIWMGRCIS